MENQDMNIQLVEQQIAESMALSAKLQAETAKLNQEMRFYPYVVAGGFGGAIVALISLVSKAI